MVTATTWPCMRPPGRSQGEGGGAGLRTGPGWAPRPPAASSEPCFLSTCSPPTRGLPPASGQSFLTPRLRPVGDEGFSLSGLRRLEAPLNSLQRSPAGGRPAWEAAVPWPGCRFSCSPAGDGPAREGLSSPVVALGPGLEAGMDSARPPGPVAAPPQHCLQHAQLRGPRGACTPKPSRHPTLCSLRAPHAGSRSPHRPPASPTSLPGCPLLPFPTRPAASPPPGHISRAQPGLSLRLPGEAHCACVTETKAAARLGLPDGREPHARSALTGAPLGSSCAPGPSLCHEQGHCAGPPRPPLKAVSTGRPLLSGVGDGPAGKKCH